MVRDSDELRRESVKEIGVHRQETIRKIVIQAKRQLYHALREKEPSPWLCPTLTVGQLRAAILLDLHGCMTPGDLALAVGVSKSSATEVIKGLIAQGLVSRKRHPDNPRSYLVYLSEKGQRQVVRLQEMGIGGVDSALAKMDQEDLLALARGMEALLRAM